MAGACKAVSPQKDTGVDEILPHLYLSNRFKASSKHTIQAYDIKTVLTVMKTPIEEEKKVDGISYEWVELDDEASKDVLSHMQSFNETIYNGLRRGNVLVHCLAGVSRSVTAIAAYLVATLAFSAQEAIAIIQEGRPRASPNDGFFNQLTVFEKRTQKEKSGGIVTQDPVAKIHVDQILEEGAKFSDFRLAKKILLNKLDQELKFSQDHEVFSLNCVKCNSLLVEWHDLILHNPAQDSFCDSYFAVMDDVVMQRNTIRTSEEGVPQKCVVCVECGSGLGEVDDWYGVKCSCSSFAVVVPGYQIRKDRISLKN